MPQTREHLEICQLLGVKKGLVALTKFDMVDNDLIGMIKEEIQEYLAGGFLAGAPIIPVSSKTGYGLEELRSALAELATTIPEKEVKGPFRVPVDRVFSVPGFGTVVTGTLIAGKIAIGEEVEILPTGRCCRVRRLEIHGMKEEMATAGQRVAVNLQGVELASIQRGNVVAPRGVFRTTRAVDARLDYLPSAHRELRHRAILRFHSATYEVPAQVILLDRKTLQPGDSAFVQLRLKSPVLLLPGDAFVLRAYSPESTVGGGRVLDPAPSRRKRSSDAALTLLKAMNSGTDGEKVRLLVAESLYAGLSQENIALRSGLTMEKAETALSSLLTGGEVVLAVREPRIVLARESFEGLKELLLAGIKEHLRDNPMKEGIGREELKGRLPRQSDPRFFGYLMADLEKERKVVAYKDMVGLFGHCVAANADQHGVREKILNLLLRGGSEPPTVRELGEALKLNEKVLLGHLIFLVREGRAIKISADLFYAPEPIANLREKLVSCLKATGEITPGAFRGLTGLSRKFMIPLLEYFDREKVTIRVGDKRVLRKG
jgi:selenocysteine-specific elongation factor